MAGAEARAKAREAGTRTCEAEPGRARVTFRRALRSEAVRMRHSPLVVLHVALAVALGALAGAYFAFSAWDSLLGTDAFFQLLGAGVPLLAGISCGLAADAEQRAGEGANVLGVSSRRGALAAKLAALLALCLMAAAIAAALFCGALALAGRSLPDTAAVALATAGIALGSLCSYAILWCVALRFGRNASVGMGTLGFIAALTLMGGLANGLVTGTFSGAFSIGAAAFVPFAWPSRLASLPLELSIAAGMGAQAQVEALVAAYATVTCACTAITAVVLAVTLAAANRFENPRRGGE